jgi:hypothetical protein
MVRGGECDERSVMREKAEPLIGTSAVVV